MRLLVTRPEPDASRTARSLEALGHDVIVSPALDILFDLHEPLPDMAFQAVVATSSNGVRALAQHSGRARLSGLPLLAVGDRSALEARRAGFALARSAGGDAAALLALARAELQPDDGPLLSIAGEPQSTDMAAELRRAGFEVRTAVLYRSQARLRLAEPAREAFREGRLDGVLLYSQRSAAAFAASLQAAALSPLPPSVAAFCLSAACAASLASVTTGPVVIAEHPDQITLFAAIERAAADRSI